MRIGIDMRMAGTGEGIARYVEELVKNLEQIDRENEYFLLFQDQATSAKRKIQSAKFKNILIKSKYYSWAEQTIFVKELGKLKLDLMHFPNFNVPLLYHGKFIITIHDIIHHFFPGKKKSRIFHRMAYRTTIRSAIKRAAKIIAVSDTTKKDILKTFKINQKKIDVLYEGINAKFFASLPLEKIKNVLAKYHITKSYLLFVGVWRQYKNLERLALAFDILRKTAKQDIQLVLVGKIDPFYPEIKEKVTSIGEAQDSRILGFVSDQDLFALYQGASVFVLPSLMEGFGLIGIEAQASKVPVAASDIPVLKEILGLGAVYFDPYDEKDMAAKIEMILRDQGLRNDVAQKALVNAKKYNWRNVAEQTLKIYREVLTSR